MTRFVLCGAILLTARAALAQDPILGIDSRPTEGSPQHFAIELRIGPYVPAIDSEFAGGAAPYAEIFGPQVPLAYGIEVDWQALRLPFASVGVGAGVGVEYVGALAPFEGSGLPSQDVTSLTLLPLSLQAVLRVDVLANEARVPLVPYAKAGLTLVPWWVSSGRGIAKVPWIGQPSYGAGVSWGWHLAAGLMLRLDDIDPQSARQMDNESGINHAYLFAEVLLARIDLGRDSLDLSVFTWVAGLALEL